MGKGDKRSFKGKVFKGSYGKTRPRHAKKAPAATGQQQQKKK
jgi:ribosomal small subunit protein bTHX